MSLPVLVSVAILLATAFSAEETCGVVKASVYNITTGDETAYGEFPWLAALEYKMAGTQYIVGMKCGGAVINKRFVLTSAQCVTLTTFEIHSVWLGVRKFSDADYLDKERVRKFGIDKQIPHESYDKNKLTNDIALLKLNSDIIFSDFISPICLPNKVSALPPSSTVLTVSGWGQTGFCGPTSDMKLKLRVPIYSHADCQDNWNVVVRADQICTSECSLESSCWRDTGVPIMESRPVGINRQWSIIGIVTSNKGYNNRHVITNTRVSSYATWIAQTINKP